MRIDVSLVFHAGIGGTPRPSLRISARAQQRNSRNELDEMVHTRLVDCPYPAGMRDGMNKALDKLQQLRHGRDWWFYDALGQDVVRQVEITVG